MLENFTDTQLEQELEQRRKARINGEKPKRLDNMDFQPLIECCSDYIDQIGNKGWADEDMKQYIFEYAMQAVFGAKVWQWVNSHAR